MREKTAGFLAGVPTRNRSRNSGNGMLALNSHYWLEFVGAAFGLDREASKLEVRSGRAARVRMCVGVFQFNRARRADARPLVPPGFAGQGFPNVPCDSQRCRVMIVISRTMAYPPRKIRKPRMVAGPQPSSVHHPTKNADTSTQSVSSPPPRPFNGDALARFASLPCKVVPFAWFAGFTAGVASIRAL